MRGSMNLRGIAVLPVHFLPGPFGYACLEELILILRVNVVPFG